MAKSSPILCDPMTCSPGFPVLRQLPELAPTHVRWASDAIQPPYPLLPPPPALNLSEHQVFSNESAFCIRWPKYWSFSISPSSYYSGLITFRIDWFDLLAVQGIPQESSPIPQFKSIHSLSLSLLYGTTLTFVHDYWKNHSFDCTDFCQQSDVFAF